MRRQATRRLTWSGILGVVFFAFSGVLNYFGSNPKIFWLPAVALCFVILYGTRELIIGLEGKWEIKTQRGEVKEAAAQSSKEIADLNKRIQMFTDVLTRSPAVDNRAQLDILKDEHDRLAEKKNELTKEDKQALEDQAITLESLESGRKRAAEVAELDKRQKENAQRQAEIKRERQAKEAIEANDRMDRGVVERLLPSCRYAAAKLYQMLEGLGKQSSLKLESDFPGGRPALEESKLVRDGKFASGEHIIRLGLDKAWEFHVSVNARPESGPMVTWMPYFTTFKIEAGGSSVTILSPRPMARPPYLLTAFNVGKEQRIAVESSFTDYQKAIDEAITALIHDRYYAQPIKAEELP